MVEDFICRFRGPDTVVVVDPVMGDYGRVYQTYTAAMCSGMARLAERAREEGAHVVCLTPDPLYGVTWHEFGTVEVRCYNIDASTMKTMLRADNGIVVLDDGTITSKKNCRDIRP